MENVHNNILDPNYIPEELKTPYDVIELPSQGLLYKDKLSKVKIEFLTAMDENILSSPNLSSNPNEMINLLIKNKVKDLNMSPEDLLDGDRMAILIFLRATAFGHMYQQMVYDPSEEDFVEVEIDLTQLEHKKLLIKPDNNNEFDFILPSSNKLVKFKFLTAGDEESIDNYDKELMKRSGDNISQKITLRLEKCVTEIDGERDKIKISNILKKLPILDSRTLRKYIEKNEPGINMETKGRTQGGGSVSCFLTLGANFFWPQL